jgi:hypothetical protein
MALTNTPIFPQTITNNVVQILPADTTTLKTLYTGATNGSRIENIMVTNTDTNAYTINIFFTISATNYLIGTINVPLSAGNTTAAPTVNLLSSAGNFGGILNYDANGNKYLYVASGTILKVASTGTVTTAKALTFSCQGGDF